MIAIKKQVLIPPSRRLEIDLPADTPEGLAKVVVLVPASTSDRASPSTLLFEGIDEEAWDAAEKTIIEARRIHRGL